MGSLTIRLDPELDKGLARLAMSQGRTKSEVLCRYIAVELFEEARRRLKPYAEKAGYLTDEDIFRDLL